jgi:ATPase subunit of ABC transporter with duplicated ATPase domains
LDILKNEIPEDCLKPVKIALEKELRSGLLQERFCHERLLTNKEILKKINNIVQEVKRRERQQFAIEILSTTIDADVSKEIFDSCKVSKSAFEALSAGQKQTILSLLDILCFIERESIILYDEPENHLHPGLLSSNIILLNKILDKFKSYAIITTHSPIVLQNVPSRSVYKIIKIDDEILFDNIDMECFGDTLSAITERILGLDEPEYDYHHILSELTDNHNFEQILDLFDGKLSLKATMYLASLFGEE